MVCATPKDVSKQDTHLDLGGPKIPVLSNRRRRRL